MKLPDFFYEDELWKRGLTVIGIDEVGRGAFAGPVAVGGVVFDSSLTKEKRKYLLSLGINDSKKLSAKKRLELSFIIKETAKAYDISFIDVATINEVGIGKATFMGMKDVVEKVKSKEQRAKNESISVLVDGFEIPSLNFSQKGIIRGDSLSISIASASIIAKVERDRIMSELGLKFPSYGFEVHKGYGTSKHRMALKKYGYSTHHRTQFISKTLV